MNERTIPHNNAKQTPQFYELYCSPKKIPAHYQKFAAMQLHQLENEPTAQNR